MDMVLVSFSYLKTYMVGESMLVKEVQADICHTDP
jgi:hypothetical protein